MTSLVVRVPLRQMYMPGTVGAPLIFYALYGEIINRVIVVAFNA